MCPERRLVDIVLVHPHLIVAIAKVHLGEVADTPQLIQQLIHHWC
jgi:hypothetical protein